MQIQSLITNTVVRYKLYIIGTLIFVAGTALGVAICMARPTVITRDIRANEQSYTFINPLLECENVTFENNDSLSSLEKRIKDHVNSSISQGEVINASVYYRDLNNGPWFEINNGEEYSPASLIKVPMMIAVYKTLESDPSFLEKTVTLDTPISYEEQNIPPEIELVQGKTYTINELMERMIIDSDNHAYEVLLEHVSPDIVTQVYTDLGIDIQKLNTENPQGDILTISSYSAFFRVLFNASYLSRTSSEEALSILARTAYKGGLVAGVEPATMIAHKYGERRFLLSDIHQLHDCGIVYNPKSPYLLCIMTKGSDFQHLEAFIATVAQQVDEEHSHSSK